MLPFAATWMDLEGIMLSDFHFSVSCIGEGNGNPLQCSCLENPRDSGAWWAAVYGVAQSRTRLKWLSSSSSSMLSETSQTEKHKYCMLPFMYVCVSCSVVSDSLQPHGLYSPPGSSVCGILQTRILEWVTIPFPWGIFSTQGSNPSLLHYSQILYCLSHHLYVESEK